MGATDRTRARLGKPEVLHLALPDEVPDRPGDVLDRHIRIDAMLIQQVDDVGLEPLERGFHDLLDVLGPAVETALLARLRIDAEAELGRDHDLPPERRQGFAYELFIGERSVDFRGIEEGDAALGRRPDQRNSVPLRDRRAVAEAEAHATQPQGRDLQAAASELSRLHRFISLLGGRRTDDLVVASLPN